MLPEPQVYSPDGLRVGLSAEFEQDVTEADVLKLDRAFRMRNHRGILGLRHLLLLIEQFEDALR